MRMEEINLRNLPEWISRIRDELDAMVNDDYTGEEAAALSRMLLLEEEARDMEKIVSYIYGARHMTGIFQFVGIL